MRRGRVPARRATGRAMLNLRTPVHRATTRNLQAVYPFVVDSTLGTRGVYIGRQAGSDASFVFDPWELYVDGVITNPNILLAGVIGRGKSALAKSLALRMTAFGVRVYVPGDPKGEWGEVARVLGAEPIALGRGLPARVTPLAPGQRPRRMPRDEWQREVLPRRNTLLASLAETALDRRLQPVERNALLVALTAVTGQHPSSTDGPDGIHGTGGPAPVLPQIVSALLDPTEETAGTLSMSARELAVESRSLALELRRLVVGDLAGLFDGPTTRRLDFDAPIQVLDTSRLAGDDTAIALLMTCASAWMETTLTTAPTDPPCAPDSSSGGHGRR